MGRSCDVDSVGEIMSRMKLSVELELCFIKDLGRL